MVKLSVYSYLAWFWPRAHLSLALSTSNCWWESAGCQKTSYSLVTPNIGTFSFVISHSRWIHKDLEWHLWTSEAVNLFYLALHTWPAARKLKQALQHQAPPTIWVWSVTLSFALTYISTRWLCHAFTKWKILHNLCIFFLVVICCNTL